MFSFCCKEALEELADDKWECTGCGNIYTKDDFGEHINQGEEPEDEA